MIRAKIKIDSVRPDGDPKTGEQIHGAAIYSSDKTTENYSFSVATPSLSLQMYISNPGAFDKLEQGKEYYLDFIPVEEI